MIFEFPRKEEDLAPADAFVAYKQLVDCHLDLLKKQSKCEFFYWKSLGIFFLLIMVFFVLQDKEFVSSPLVGIALTGVGALLAIFQNMQMDLKYGIKAKTCVEMGMRIEEKYDYPQKLFKIFEENKMHSYRGNLLSRLFPTGLIGLATGGAATLLALKVEIWLFIAVGILSIFVLYVLARSYIKTARKILLSLDRSIY